MQPAFSASTISAAHSKFYSLTPLTPRYWSLNQPIYRHNFVLVKAVPVTKRWYSPTDSTKPKNSGLHPYRDHGSYMNVSIPNAFQELSRKIDQNYQNLDTKISNLDNKIDNLDKKIRQFRQKI